MSRIFICYRRSDSSAYAGWLHDLLRQHFTEDEVFRDIDSLQGGERWVGRIDETLARCNVVVPVIGPTWLTSALEGGAGRRLEDPDDRVRLELEAAIRRGVPLIPLLVGGATMPHREELPASLQPLVDWQAMRFSDETREHDVVKLREAISRTLEIVPGELRLGTVFAGHEIEALVGKGGMGIVYRGPHVQLGRVDAIKVIAPQFAREPEFRERFVRESRLASGLQHVNLLRVYDAGEESGLLYLVMQLVHGEDLAAAIRNDGPLEPVRAATIIGRAAAALQAAHEHGLVHRDVKPGNILIEPTGGGDELVFLGDFGLARETTTATGLSTTGRWMGTADYVSPEQVMGEPLDARADVYALGCVLFEALTGRVPYPMPSQTAKLVAHATRDAPSLEETRPGLGRELGEVVRIAMSRDPDVRYPSAAAFRAALEAAVGLAPPVPAPTMPPPAAEPTPAPPPAAEPTPAPPPAAEPTPAPPPAAEPTPPPPPAAEPAPAPPPPLRAPPPEVRDVTPRPEPVQRAPEPEPEPEDIAREPALVRLGATVLRGVGVPALASGIIALIGCAASWYHEDYGKLSVVDAGRVAVAALTIGVLAVLAVHRRTPHELLPRLAAWLAAIATVLTAFAFVWVEREATYTRSGMYLSLFGVASLLSYAVFLARRQPRGGTIATPGEGLTWPQGGAAPALASGIIAVASTATPWYYDYYSKVGFVAGVHVAVAALTIGALGLLAAHLRWRLVLLPRFAALLAAVATGLTVLAFVKTRLNVDCSCDLHPQWGLYFALAGTGCFLLCSGLFAIRQSRRERVPIGAPAAR